MGASGHNYSPPPNPPMYRIGLSLPTGGRNANATSNPANDNNWRHVQNTFQQDLNASPVPQIRISNSFDLRVYLYPTHQDVFNKNPEIWLFRQVNRTNSGTSVNKFRADGKHWVHPTHYPVVGNTTINNHRFYGGVQNCNMARVTEVPLPITNDFYGGSAASPNGLNFPFKPLAWFNTQPQDIENQSITFPQPFNNDTGTGIIPIVGGIEGGLVGSSIGQGYSFWYGGVKRRANGKRCLKAHFALALMIDNPDYDGGTQIAKKILVSNFVDFSVGFRSATLRDTDGFFKKFATNWQFFLGHPSIK